MPRLLILLFCLFPFLATTQVIVTPRIYCPIPKELRECSSLEAINDSLFWSLNDKGDKARIYGFSKNKLLRTLKLSKTEAHDFEAMAMNRDTRALFIGDIGNNGNDRKNLAIWKISDPDHIPGNSVKPERISFIYPDQDKFPPDAAGMNFDAEAMLHFRNQIWIFSKDRSGNHFSKAYSLPDSAGTYVAQLHDSIQLSRWVTSADISPDGKKMVLLSETDAWLFFNFSGDDFFHGQKIHFHFTDVTQKEGVCFLNDTTLLISDETSSLGGGFVYRLDLGNWLRKAGDSPLLHIENGPSPNLYQFSLLHNNGRDTELEIISAAGDVVLQQKFIHDPLTLLNACMLDFGGLPKGEYEVRVKDARGPIVSEMMNNR